MESFILGSITIKAFVAFKRCFCYYRVSHQDFIGTSEEVLALKIITLDYTVILMRGEGGIRSCEINLLLAQVLDTIL